MARNENSPIGRGQTYYGLGQTPDPAFGPGGINLEGKEFLFEPHKVNAYSNTPTDPSGRFIRAKIVRNRSGVALLPKRVARWAQGQTADAGYGHTTGVDGYYNNATTDIPAGVIDEYLPPQGVAPNDLFLLVVEGPTTVLSATTGTISIAASAFIAAAPGTNATSADAGYVVAMNTTSTTLAQYLAKVGVSEAYNATIAATSTAFAAYVNFHSA